MTYKKDSNEYLTEKEKDDLEEERKIYQMSLKVFFIFIPLYTINFAFGVLCEQALGYVIYLEIIAFLPCIPAICFDTCGSKEWKFIKEFKEKNTCKNIMEDLISKEPKITSHIKCWHKEKIYLGKVKT